MTHLRRQGVPPHPTFQRFNQYLNEDRFLLRFELLLLRAHAKSLAACEILSRSEFDAIEHGLSEIKQAFEGQDGKASNVEDLHSWLESELVARVGVAGKKMQSVRVRNDQLATLLKMYVISEGERFAASLQQLVSMSARRAVAWSAFGCSARTSISR